MAHPALPLSDHTIAAAVASLRTLADRTWDPRARESNLWHHHVDLVDGPVPTAPSLPLARGLLVRDGLAPDLRAVLWALPDRSVWAWALHPDDDGLAARAHVPTDLPSAPTPVRLLALARVLGTADGRVTLDARVEALTRMLGLLSSAAPAPDLLDAQTYQSLVTALPAETLDPVLRHLESRELRAALLRWPDRAWRVRVLAAAAHDPTAAPPSVPAAGAPLTRLDAPPPGARLRPR